MVMGKQWQHFNSGDVFIVGNFVVVVANLNLI